MEIPAPGRMGSLHFDPRSEITYGFSRTVAWQPIVKAALIATAVLRHDLELRIQSRTGKVPIRDALQALKAGGEDVGYLLAPPRWPEPAVPQMDLLWESRGSHIAVHVGMLGVRCGMIMLEGTGSNYPLDPFSHYTSMLDSPEEFLYPTKEAYDTHQAVHLHDAEIARVILEECREAPERLACEEPPANGECEPHLSGDESSPGGGPTGPSIT